MEDTYMDVGTTATQLGNMSFTTSQVFNSSDNSEFNISLFAMETTEAGVEGDSDTGASIAQDCSYRERVWKFQSDFGLPYPYLALFTCMAGLSLNLITIAILQKKTMRTPVNVLLLILVITEGVCLLIYMPYLVMRMWEPPESVPSTTQYKAVAYYYLIKADAVQLLQMIVLWLTILTATFRSLYILFPLKARMLCSTRRALYGAVTVIVCSMLTNVLNIYRNDVGRDEYKGLILYTVNMRRSIMKVEGLANAILYTMIFVGKIIPCFILVILTVLLLHLLRVSASRQRKLRMSSVLRSGTGEEAGIRKEHHHGHSSSQEYHRTTILLLAMVFLFILVELPGNILVIMYLVTHNNCYFTVYANIQDFMELLLIIGYSFSFLLYCAMSKKFRDIFIDTLHNICGRCKLAFRYNRQQGLSGETSPVTFNSRLSADRNSGNHGNSEKYVHPEKRPFVESKELVSVVRD